MPKVLIITYYWPPAGGSGVQRWLKFTKYLREFGWEPVIYTAEKAEAPGYDENLLKEVPEGIEVLRKTVWEPYSLFRIFTGRKNQKFGAGLSSQGKSKWSFANKLAIWIRGNIFIPDARMFWIRPSAKFLVKYLLSNSVDAIVSTGPPHSTHLIAKRVTKKTGFPWLADFRDPWTNIDFFNDLNPSAHAVRRHKRLEKSVLSTADCTVTVTPGSKPEFKELGAKRIEVVENGYDEKDFEESTSTLDQHFSITHVGTLTANRNCNLLWESIGKIAQSNPKFAEKLKLRFVGQVDATVIESLKKYQLSEFCEFTGYLSHNDTVNYQQESQVLLLLVNNSPNARSILTGKVFEYLAAKRPILALGPSGGDVELLVNSTSSGVFVPFDSSSRVEEGLLKLWDWYQKDWEEFNPQNIEKYSRRSLTQRIAILLNEITAEKK